VFLFSCCSCFSWLKHVIPIPVKNLSKICEDFAARQGSADAVCLEGTEGGGADAGLLQKDQRIRTVLGSIDYKGIKKGRAFWHKPMICHFGHKKIHLSIFGLAK